MLLCELNLPHQNWTIFLALKNCMGKRANLFLAMLHLFNRLENILSSQKLYGDKSRLVIGNVASFSNILSSDQGKMNFSSAIKSSCNDPKQGNKGKRVGIDSKPSIRSNELRVPNRYRNVPPVCHLCGKVG